MTTPPLPTPTSLAFNLYAPHDLEARLDLTLTLPDSLSARARLRLTHALAMKLEEVVTEELQRIAAELDGPVSEQQLLALGADESAALWAGSDEALEAALRNAGQPEEFIAALLALRRPPASSLDSDPPPS